FMGAQSLQKPAQYEGKTGADATANANIAARLPYLFASCRFAHYLKCMVRDKVGSFAEREDMERYLSEWIQNYVLPNPSTVGDEMKARKPLAAAEVAVTEIEGNPGYYAAKFHLRPPYQLEGVSISLSLVSRLPSQMAGCQGFFLNKSNKGTGDIHGRRYVSGAGWHQGRVGRQGPQGKDRHPGLELGYVEQRHVPPRQWRRRGQGQFPGPVGHQVHRQVLRDAAVQLRDRQAHCEGQADHPQGGRQAAGISDDLAGEDPGDRGVDRRVER